MMRGSASRAQLDRGRFVAEPVHAIRFVQLDVEAGERIGPHGDDHHPFVPRRSRARGIDDERSDEHRVPSDARFRVGRKGRSSPIVVGAGDGRGHLRIIYGWEVM